MGRRGEAGAGLIATVFGVGAFLAFLLFAAQVLLGLYTRSMVGATTYDAARSVAAVDGQRPEMADAEANARSQLGAYGHDVRFDWNLAEADRDVVVHLTTTGPAPSLLPRLLGAVGLGDIRRSVTVRREKVR